MPYRYNYDALLSADPNASNNFKPLGDVYKSQDYAQNAVGVLESKGVTADKAAAYINQANQAGTTVGALQNIANLTEADVAKDASNIWGGTTDDDTVGKSFLESVMAGETVLEGGIAAQIDQLYKQGFSREGKKEGKDFWEASGYSIEKIAESFLASEEASSRDKYHEHYNRDAEQEGLDFWMTEGHTAHHSATDSSWDFDRILSHRGDEYEQPETTARDLLSSQLGLHSTDAQRAGDTSLGGVYTAPDFELVKKLMNQGDKGAAEIANMVKMQKAAQHMGDYGGGIQGGTATNIHRILSQAEMAQPGRLNMTAADYIPRIENTYDDDGNLIQQRDANVWSLLKAGTQNYDVEDVVDKIPKEDDDGTTIVKDDKDKITVNTDSVDYMPDLHSDVKDTSSYGQSKAAFDNAAAGIDAPLQDMMIRNTGEMGVGGSAEGVRLKRSKKFKSGEAALGTTQLGRQLQLKSLNL